MAVTNTIILSKGAISVTLPFIDFRSVFSSRQKVFTKFVHTNGDVTVQFAPNAKRFWRIDYNIALTESEYVDLETLCYNEQEIVLAEDWVDVGTFNVFFQSLGQRLNSPSKLSRRLTMEFQQI